MRDVNLYFRYLKINFLSGIQYKGWPMQMLLALFGMITDPIGVLLLFHRFGSIGDWSISRVMLVYGLAVSGFGLAELFSRGFDVFPWHINRGVYDRILLRPRNTVTQILGMRFDIQKLSKVVVGLFMVFWSLSAQGVQMNFIKYFQLFSAFIGGFFTYTGVFIFSSAIAFWTIQGLDWIYIFTNVSTHLSKCPPHLLPTFLRNIFIYIMPMMVFCYFPAASICNWNDNGIVGWLALPVGLIFMYLSTLFFKVGTSHYTSTGS